LFAKDEKSAGFVGIVVEVQGINIFEKAKIVSRTSYQALNILRMICVNYRSRRTKDCMWSWLLSNLATCSRQIELKQRKWTYK
jgi:hypothetical protein